MKAKRSKTTTARKSQAGLSKLRKGKKKRTNTSAACKKQHNDNNAIGPMQILVDGDGITENAGPDYALDPVASQLRAQRLLEYYFSDKAVHQTYAHFGVSMNEYLAISQLATYGRLKALRCSASILHAAASASEHLQLDDTFSAVRRRKPCKALPKSQEVMKSIYAFGFPSNVSKDEIDVYFSQFGLIEVSESFAERNGGYTARYVKPESATQAVSRRHYYNGAAFSVTFANNRTKSNKSTDGPLSLPTELYVPGCLIIIDNIVQQTKVPELSSLKSFFARYSSVRCVTQSEMMLSSGAIIVEFEDACARQVCQLVEKSATDNSPAEAELNPALQDVFKFVSKSCVLRPAAGPVEIEYQISVLKARLARISGPSTASHRSSVYASASNMSARRQRTRKVKLLRESIRVLTTHLNRFQIPAPSPVAYSRSQTCKSRSASSTSVSPEMLPFGVAAQQDDIAIADLLCGFQNVRFDECSSI